MTIPLSASRTLLIVDDDPDDRMLLSDPLHKAGFEITEAGSGEAALQLCRNNRYSAVITDGSMPGIDGFRLTRALRADPAWAHLPIIMVSGLEGQDWQDKAYESGVTAFLAKRTGRQALVQQLRGVLDGAS